MAKQRDWEDDQTYWENRKQDNRYELESSERWAKIRTGLMESKALGRWIEQIEATRSQDDEAVIIELLTRGIAHPQVKPQNPARSSLGFGPYEYLKRDCMVSKDGIGDGFITVAELQCAIQIYKGKNDANEARISQEMLQCLRDGNYDAKDYLPEPLQALNRNQRRWAVVMLLLSYEGDVDRPDWGDITKQIVDKLRRGCRDYLQSEYEIDQAMKEIDEIEQRLGFH